MYGAAAKNVGTSFDTDHLRERRRQKKRAK